MYREDECCGEGRNVAVLGIFEPDSFSIEGVTGFLYRCVGEVEILRGRNHNLTE
ncbi:unnamed protein product [Arabidopsis thaliana]|uniref:(thale cress) hypothetical protein n=1 Tax=Arabidopsis thaliana TaxID=3702 RepID=A0A7G2EWH1_ARATH|nr:unnamed protein product [Arabidopsis thaliana]